MTGTERTELTGPLRAAFLGLLERNFGLRPGRQAGLVAQVDGLVMQLLATTTYSEPADLYAALAAGLLPQVLEVLATSMTVGETHFFRVTPQIEALRRVILPDLIALHHTDRRLRLWSAGCSTGEEPYTLAMLLVEQFSELADWDIQLVATDLNRAALEVARLGVYGEWSFRDSPLDLRTRYFSSTAKQWRLNDRIKGMVRFEQLNLAEAFSSFQFPFASVRGGIDLILCRNVTIYFGEQATQRLYQRFAEALQPTGWLLLGPSDPVPAPESSLEVVALDGALVWRRRHAATATKRPPSGKHALPAKQHAAAKHPAPPKHVTVAKRSVLPGRAASADRGTTESAARARASGAQAPVTPSMDPLVHLHLGMTQLGEGAPAAAIDSLRRAAFLDETSALVQFSLGTAYRELGDQTRSRSAFARARRLLAGQANDQRLSGGDVAIGELRHAVEAQLADLDRTRR